MVGSGDPTHEELSAAKAARLAARRLERQEEYLHLVRLARRYRTDNGYDAAKLGEVIQQGEDEQTALLERAGGRILPRRRPLGGKGVDTTCTIFVDECGSHALKAKDRFGAFSLAAVIIRDANFPVVDRQWKRWKREYLGSSSKLVHEPNIRDGREAFWCDGNSVKRARAIRALDAVIARLKFTAVVCVLNRAQYMQRWGDTPIDEALPSHPYLMALDFLAERLAIALHSEPPSARGRLVFESRGPLEDATIQYEFARLLLDGTSYVSDTWFRHQFFPGLEFRSKRDNSTGLQLADLMARPCGEKVINPRSAPARWHSFRHKLCRITDTKHTVIGMKIVPWEECYEGVWDT